MRGDSVCRGSLANGGRRVDDPTYELKISPRDWGPDNLVGEIDEDLVEGKTAGDMAG
jgi:hypothetical protein